MNAISKDKTIEVKISEDGKGGCLLTIPVRVCEENSVSTNSLVDGCGGNKSNPATDEAKKRLRRTYFTAGPVTYREVRATPCTFHSDEGYFNWPIPDFFETYRRECEAKRNPIAPWWSPNMLAREDGDVRFVSSSSFALRLEYLNADGDPASIPPLTKLFVRRAINVHNFAGHVFYFTDDALIVVFLFDEPFPGLDVWQRVANVCGEHLAAAITAGEFVGIRTELGSCFCLDWDSLSPSYEFPFPEGTTPVYAGRPPYPTAQWCERWGEPSPDICLEVTEHKQSIVFVVNGEDEKYLLEALDLHAVVYNPDGGKPFWDTAREYIADDVEVMFFAFDLPSAEYSEFFSAVLGAAESRGLPLWKIMLPTDISGTYPLTELWVNDRWKEVVVALNCTEPVTPAADAIMNWEPFPDASEEDDLEDDDQEEEDYPDELDDEAVGLEEWGEPCLLAPDGDIELEDRECDEGEPGGEYLEEASRMDGCADSFELSDLTGAVQTFLQNNYLEEPGTRSYVGEMFENFCDYYPGYEITQAAFTRELGRVTFNGAPLEKRRGAKNQNFIADLIRFQEE